jgi:hypothetical protein
MDGYNAVFEVAEKDFKNVTDTEILFKNFRNSPSIYGFICNGDTAPDYEAVDISKKLNTDMFNNYIECLSTRKILGYGDIDTKDVKFPFFNSVDSRHVMMSIVCFGNIKHPIKNIVEIGGGYGNWLFLNRNVDFERWYIIDLPHVGKLQKWYLTENNIPENKFAIVSAYDYESKDITPELVIGSHSLSEVKFDIFKMYFDKVIIRSKYLFYAFHTYSLSKILLDSKMNLINGYFKELARTPSQSGSVLNILFVRR